ncbi:MAG: shikimate kinase [Eubacteriales bacterium]
MHNISLIGMPGAGKSTLGVLAAKALGLSFVDTDLILQRRIGCLLSDYIRDKGIAAFLEAEREAVLSCRFSDSIIATGGSVVLSPEAVEHLKRTGSMIYISVPITTLERRVKNIASRGIVMEGGETIRDVYAKRAPLYSTYADKILDVSDSEDMEKACERLIRLISDNK